MAKPAILSSASAHGTLDARSIALRHAIVDALIGGRRGHVGSSFSLVEILRVLYDDVLSYRATEPKWNMRDRCILSKGHGCLALYAILADKGFFPREELALQCTPGALLGGHPDPHIPGVEASTGSLGHGLGLGVGMALAARMRRSDNRVFVIMGDGELQEGSIWEAALTASKYHLNNLVAIVDYNKLQSYGPVSEVLPLEPLADKWRAFGFAVREVDGHDVFALRDALGALPFEGDKPNILIAHTVKGKGIPFAENDPDWHHKATVDAEMGARLRAALEAA
ncbi:MAG: transketolase [Vulcanimicrobiaceae bacterium]